MELNIKENDKILVVAPHQDDETIGCGGLLAMYGKKCDVLLLTDGRLGNAKMYKDLDELVKIRNNELDKTCKIVSVNKITRLPIQNEQLTKHIDIVKNVDIKEYDYIFIPYRKDMHPDHKVCYKIFKSMISSQKAKAQLIEYEVWTPLETPTYILDISDIIETKKKMLKEYKSQLKEKDYLGATLGLNKYRGMFIEKKYGEAYMHSIYSGLKVKLYESLPDSAKDKIKNMISK